MATWTAPLPPSDTAAGDPGHPGMHNELVVALTEVRTNVDLNLPANDPRLTAGAAGTATVRAIGATATTVIAGNDARLAPAAVGTASVRALAGGTALTASASDHKHVIADITDSGAFGKTLMGADSNGTAQLALGITATGSSIIEATNKAAAATAIAAGTPGSGVLNATTAAAAQTAIGITAATMLLTGTAPTIANSTATDVPGLVTNFNALLTALRTRGVIA